jgi:acetyl-CoA/propionyl-CoA carboxylase biotin carboxyl carrier protein
VQSAEGGERTKVVVVIGGKRLDILLPAGIGVVAGVGAGGGDGLSASVPTARRSRLAGRRTGPGRAATGGEELIAPMTGTVVALSVAEGQTVQAGDTVLVMEAMKMEQPLQAHRSGRIAKLTAAVGDVVGAGEPVCRIEEAA